MIVKLIVEDINNDDEEYFSDLIYRILDKIISKECNRIVDSVIINYQNGEEEEVR